MALGERMRGSGARVVCVLSDGELQEGAVWEAIMFAGARGLANLTLVVNDNGEQADGATRDVLDLGPIAPKLEAFGLRAREVDGHDLPALRAALAEARDHDGPSAVVARTTPGRGGRGLRPPPPRPLRARRGRRLAGGGRRARRPAGGDGAMSLEGEVALITGAAQGIGLACAEAMAALGARVALTDVRGDAARERAAAIEGAEGWALDTGERDDVIAKTAEIAEALGAPTILVANAGIQRTGASETLPREVWDRSLAVNLTGVWDCIQAVAPAMLERRHGAIVTLASVNSERGMPGRAPYCATKTAIVGLTRALAVEWASRGVRVNAVAPGYVRTPMVQKAIDEGLVDEAQLLDRIPMRALPESRDVADAVVYLASAKARFVTGQVLPVDGGYLAYGAPRPTSELPMSFSS